MIDIAESRDLARKLPLCLAAPLLLLSGIAIPAAAEESAPPTTLKEVVYQDHGGRQMHLDIYSTADRSEGPAPVVLYFHGGAWARGARPADGSGFRSYLDAGFSVVAVEYRLAGEASAPAAVQDVRCALKWVGANAERMGFDQKRIIVYGTSAGGHLALMAGLLPTGNEIDLPSCKDAPRPAAILDFFGPTDLTTIRSIDGKLHPAVPRWIGEVPDLTKAARNVSPVHWLDKSAPPVFIVHGDADEVVPISQSIDLDRRLAELGVQHEFVIVPGGGHGKFNPEDKAKVNDRLMSFLCSVKVRRAAQCTK